MLASVSANDKEAVLSVVNNPVIKTSAEKVLIFIILIDLNIIVCDVFLLALTLVQLPIP